MRIRCVRTWNGKTSRIPTSVLWYNNSNADDTVEMSGDTVTRKINSICKINENFFLSHWSRFIFCHICFATLCRTGAFTPVIDRLVTTHPKIPTLELNFWRFWFSHVRPHRSMAVFHGNNRRIITVSVYTIPSVDEKTYPWINATVSRSRIYGLSNLNKRVFILMHR